MEQYNNKMDSTQQEFAIGRLDFISPNADKHYFLWALLMQVKVVTPFSERACL